VKEVKEVTEEVKEVKGEVKVAKVGKKTDKEIYLEACAKHPATKGCPSLTPRQRRKRHQKGVAAGGVKAFEAALKKRAQVSLLKKRRPGQKKAKHQKVQHAQEEAEAEAEAEAEEGVDAGLDEEMEDSGLDVGLDEGK
jgi:hypothetical protein